jgi:uncharacterized protein (UPF0210 family)
MINTKDILETIKMIHYEHLDIRTITMGISLMDCCSSSANISCRKIYDKISKKAEHLVSAGEKIEEKYGIPIINKRIAVTPIAIINASCPGNAIAFARALEKAAEEAGVNFIGGYSALVQKGFAPGDLDLISAIPAAMTETERVCSSVNIGATKSGINLDAVKIMGETLLQTAILSKDRDSLACAKIVIFCNVPDDNPFMAGAFHGIGQGDCVINVGVSGPGVIRAALREAGPKRSITEIAEIIKKTAFKITRMGQLAAMEASEMLGVDFGIVDLSLAPTPVIGDSVAHILEEIGLEHCGAHGTTAALAILNDAVKKGGVMASSQVGGLSGAFIPVTEDIGMADAVRRGYLSLEKLEAMTAVCSVGLDMIAVPGDVSAEIIAAIIADEAAIGMINNKTTAVRIIPAYGKKATDEVNFGGLLGGGPVMKVNYASPAVLINRGGQIPAPIQSLKN